MSVEPSRVGSFAPRDAPDTAAPHPDARPRKPRSAPAAFLGGAIGRLLPPSIPFRYFGAAATFHVLAWLALLAGADAAPRFRGGLGWTTAALHLVTLGVLVMTAIGASLQLLPVATRQSVRHKYGPVVVFWLYVPGVAIVAIGMGLALPPVLAAGALLIATGLAVYAVVLARNLFGARGMPGVVAHVWAAWLSLAVVMIAALSLAGAYVGRPALPRDVALALHVPFAAFGFMGMLALGLSYIVVPMFALARMPDERPALASCALAAAALVATAVAAFGIAAMPLRVAALVAGACSVALHVRLMSIALRTGMRRELGPSFVLVRIAWGMLAASLIAALGVVLDAPFDGMPALFGVALVAGWLLTFVLGILQRIVPFLASMHAGRGTTRLPTPSSLTSVTALRVHFIAHLAALALLVIAIVADNAWIVRLAAICGATGAVAFLAFFIAALRRMTASRAGAKPAVAAA